MEEIKTAHTVYHQFIFIIGLPAFTELINKVMIILIISIIILIIILVLIISFLWLMLSDLTLLSTITLETPFDSDLKCLMFQMTMQIAAKTVSFLLLVRIASETAK